MIFSRNKSIRPTFGAGVLPAVRGCVCGASHVGDDGRATQATDDGRCRLHNGIFRFSEETSMGISVYSICAAASPSGKCRMDFVAWIKAGLKQPGKTQHGLAMKLGRADSAVSAMLRDGRHIKASEIELISEYLEIDPPFQGIRKRVPISGCIKGGQQLEIILFAENSVSWIAVPAGGEEADAALLVEGHSMQGLIKDGWAVFYGKACQPPTADQIDELCVCELDSGKIIIGFLKHSRYEGRYDIEVGSNQELLAQNLKWAATVTNLVTRSAVAQLRRQAAEIA